ncbi:MAG: SPFH domain-containing protein [Planctomycetota bacterium]
MPLHIEPWMIGVGSVAAFFLFFFGVGLLVKRFYQKCSADEALVKTGMGGTKVVIGGGMLVLPVLQQVMRVSLRTITLTVERSGRLALVTADKIKACCTMELYIKVDDTEEAVVAAARSFGSRNVDEGVLAEIVEGKLTDALRGVAANKTFHDLHAQREEFAEAVKKALVDELRKNGLKLESTSLTSLNQLPKTEMDPNDVFDAEGLRNINETVANNVQQANEIERRKEVTIQQQDVSARKEALRLEKERAFIEAEQAKEISEYRATKKAEERMAVLLQEQAAAEAALSQKRQIETAQIAQEEAVATRDLKRQEEIAKAKATKEEAERTAQILAVKAIQAAEIEKEMTVQAAEIEKAKAIEAAEIAKKRTIEAAEVEKRRTIEAAEVEKRRTIEVAEVEKAVALAQAETEKSRAEAEKAEAVATEAAAIESITTAEQTARARREKEIAVIKAEEESDRSKIKADEEAYKAERAAGAEREVKRARAEAVAAEAGGVAAAVRERAQAAADEKRTTAQALADELRTAAEARKQANELEATGEAQRKRISAQALADEVRVQAEAEADRIRVEAHARAEACDKEAVAKIRLAEATLKEGEAQAEARKLMVEAENAVDSRILLLRAAQDAIAISPDLMREFVKSAEAIGEMKVLQIGGSGFSGSGGGEGGDFMGELGKTPLGLGLTTLAQGTALLPLIKGLMEHAGVGKDDVLDKVKAAVAAGAAEFGRNGHAKHTNGNGHHGQAEQAVAVLVDDEELPPSLKR